MPSSKPEAIILYHHRSILPAGAIQLEEIKRASCYTYNL